MGYVILKVSDCFLFIFYIVKCLVYIGYLIFFCRKNERGGEEGIKGKKREGGKEEERG